MLQRWRHGRLCRKQAKVCKEPSLEQYLNACGQQNWDHIENTPLISVDLELTGLNSECDEIIAIGWTLIDRGRIQFGSNRHMLIRPGQTVGDSAVIHELTDREVAQGESLEQGLQALFTAATGRIWVFHHAGLDIAFLKQACQRWAGAVPGFIVLDTLRIEYRQRRRRGVLVRQGDLQLGRIRKVYGLPDYRPHHALVDATATAEVMLAIAASMEPGGPLDLGPHLKYF
jgi:DNA polymerase-3 subunit epsilon